MAEVPTEEPMPMAPPDTAFEAPEPAMDFGAPDEVPEEAPAEDMGFDLDADASLDLNMGADEGEVDAPADTGLEFDLNMDTDAAADEPAIAEEPSISADPAFPDTADDMAGMGLEDDAGVAALDLGEAADAGVDFDISEGADAAGVEKSSPS